MTIQTKLFLAGTFVAALAGCSTTPMWDARFGEPVRVIAAQQTLDPDASRNADPVKGVDGKAAQGAMGDYTKTFTQPIRESGTFTIDVGSGSGR